MYHETSIYDEDYSFTGFEDASTISSSNRNNTVNYSVVAIIIISIIFVAGVSYSIIKEIQNRKTKNNKISNLN